MVTMISSNFTRIVVIKRQGLDGKLHFGFHRVDKTIYLNQISGIKLKEPKIMMEYIQFIHPENIERTKDGSVVNNSKKHVNL